MSIHKLRRQLTALNKKLRWYEGHAECHPMTRRKRRAYMRRMFERGNIRSQLALMRANVPWPLESEYLEWSSKLDAERRGFYIPR